MTLIVALLLPGACARKTHGDVLSDAGTEVLSDAGTEVLSDAGTEVLHDLLDALDGQLVSADADAIGVDALDVPQGPLCSWPEEGLFGVAPATSGDDAVKAVAALPGGGYVVALNCSSGTLHWGGQLFPGADCAPGLACSSPAIAWVEHGGPLAKLVRLDVPGLHQLEALAVDADGRVFAAGTTDSASFAFGTEELPGHGGQDGLVLAFAADGGPLWAWRFGGTLDDGVSALAAAGDGGLFVGGWFESPTVEIDGTGHSLADQDCVLMECGDLLFARLDGSGSPVWSRAVGGNQGERMVSLVRLQGGFAAAGWFGSWTIDFGGAALTMKETICGPMFGCSDLFVVRLDDGGEHVASAAFGGDLLDLPAAAAATSTGDILVSGHFSSSSLDFGGGPLVNSGDEEGFVVLIDEKLSHLWSHRFDGRPLALASGEDGSAYVGGSYGPYDQLYGACPLPQPMGKGGFLVRIDGGGDYAETWAFAGTGSQSVNAVVQGAQGLLAGGSFSGQTALPILDGALAEGTDGWLLEWAGE